MPIKAKWIPFKKEIVEALAMKESGVYEIGKMQGDIVLYIGMSDTSIRSRLLTHTGETKFIGCTHFRKRTINSDAGRAEDNLLEGYKKKNGKYPPLNKNKSTGGDPWKGILY